VPFWIFADIPKGSKDGWVYSIKRAPQIAGQSYRIAGFQSDPHFHILTVLAQCVDGRSRSSIAGCLAVQNNTVEPHSFIKMNKQHAKRISRTLIGRTFPMVFPYKIRLRADWIARDERRLHPGYSAGVECGRTDGPCRYDDRHLSGPKELPGTTGRSDERSQFFGIRYGQAPVATLRWKPPQAPNPGQGSIIAGTVGPACVQGRATDSEDCLFLNVYTPSTATAKSKLPVCFHMDSLRRRNSARKLPSRDPGCAQQ
jgi:hypothetical protein